MEDYTAWIIFSLSLIVYFVVAVPEKAKLMGRKGAVRSSVITAVILILVICLSTDRAETLKQLSIGSLIVTLFYILFADRLLASRNKKEAEDLMKKILVESWYWHGGTGFWCRNSEVFSLLSWARVNGKTHLDFDIKTLRAKNAYHWIHLQAPDLVDLPKPESELGANILGRMYVSHRLGPYSKLDDNFAVKVQE